MSIQSEVRFFDCFRDVDSFDWHLSCHRNQIIRQEVYMKRALTVPQPRFCNLSLLFRTWLLISLHVDLQGFIQGFLAHVLILDVHSRCFPLACPALCRCHGHLCFSHACRRQEPQEPPANNFFQTFLCLPLGCFLLMFVEVFSHFFPSAAFSGAALLANQSIYTCSRITSVTRSRPRFPSCGSCCPGDEMVFWDVTLCLKRESVSWDVSYIGFLCWYLRFALMFTHVDALFIMIHSSCLFILLLFGAWMPGTTAALTEQMAREIGLAICRHNSCGNWFLWMWKRMRWPRIFFATSGFHEAWSWSAIGSRKMRGCQIAEARTWNKRCIRIPRRLEECDSDSIDWSFCHFLSVTWPTKNSTRLTDFICLLRPAGWRDWRIAWRSSPFGHGRGRESFKMIWTYLNTIEDNLWYANGRSVICLCCLWSVIVFLHFVRLSIILRQL